MLYLVPTFHNPTGISTSLARGRRLVQLAKKHDVLILCDDVYNLLTYSEAKPPPRLFSLDADDPHSGRVISNGSLSKLLSPGFRLGWLEAPSWATARLRSSCGILRSGGSMNNVSAAIVADAIRNGDLQRHINHLKAVYSKRVAAMANIMLPKLPSAFTLKRPAGGYFLWVSGPADFSAQLLAERLEARRRVKVFPGDAFTIEGQHGGQHCFRISIAYYEEDVLAQAATVITEELKAMYPE